VDEAESASVVSQIQTNEAMDCSSEYEKNEVLSVSSVEISRDNYMGVSDQLFPTIPVVAPLSNEELEPNHEPHEIAAILDAVVISKIVRPIQDEPLQKSPEKAGNDLDSPLEIEDSVDSCDDDENHKTGSDEHVVFDTDALGSQSERYPEGDEHDKDLDFSFKNKKLEVPEISSAETNILEKSLGPCKDDYDERHKIYPNKETVDNEQHVIEVIDDMIAAASQHETHKLQTLQDDSTEASLGEPSEKMQSNNALKDEMVSDITSDDISLKHSSGLSSDDKENESLDCALSKTDDSTDTIYQAEKCSYHTDSNVESSDTDDDYSTMIDAASTFYNQLSFYPAGAKGLPVIPGSHLSSEFSETHNKSPPKKRTVRKNKIRLDIETERIARIMRGSYD